MGVLLKDVGGEDGEEHHAERGEQDAEYLADGGDGEDFGTDGGDVHPGPPERVAEAVELGVDARFVLEEDERRDVGEDHDREDIGNQQTPHLVVAGEPPHDDDHGQQRPQHGEQSDDHAPVARDRDAAPAEDVEPRDGDEEEKQVAPEVAAFLRRGCPLGEEIEQEDDADRELDAEVEIGKARAAAADDLPRQSHEQDQAGDDGQRCERAAQPFVAGGRMGQLFLSVHNKSFFELSAPAADKISAKGGRGNFSAIFPQKILHERIFRLSLHSLSSHGGIAQLVRAHDS